MQNIGRVGCLVLAVLIADFAWACLWDDDTLRFEHEQMPGVAEAVLGLFPQYPDEYYERRIEIARERILADPFDLNAYDNLAVSLDRLGRSGEAIEAIASKLGAIEESSAPGDHLYRYHANLGTFFVHRWISSVGPEFAPADLVSARDHVARAVEINPEAHFGRERVQLGAIDWLLDADAGGERVWWMGTRPTLASAFLEDGEMLGPSRRMNDEVIDGLVGLVVLGNAWQSVDVMEGLSFALRAEQHASLAALAWCRAEELRSRGASSLHPAVRSFVYARGFDDHSDTELIAADLADVKAYFEVGRSAAEAFRLDHAAFVHARLQAGLHPDTHADFWVGEPMPDVPGMPNGLFGSAGQARTAMEATIWVVVGGIGTLAVAGAAIWWWRRSRMTAATIST